eukprot:6196597-Heterocapsa_arctica.AAC.1
MMKGADVVLFDQPLYRRAQPKAGSQGVLQDYGDTPRRAEFEEAGGPLCGLVSEPHAGLVLCGQMRKSPN